jgi:type I restriction enzyme S subunit
MKNEDSVLDRYVFPDEWQKFRFDEIFFNSKETTVDEHSLLGAYLNGGVLKRFDGDGRPSASEDLSKYKVVKQDDIIMNPLGKPHGSIGRSDFVGITSPAYWVLRCRDERFNPRYFHYLLRSKVMLNEFKRRSKDLPPNQFDLPWEQFRSIELRIPPLALQLDVANYLDERSEYVRCIEKSTSKQISLLLELSRSQTIPFFTANEPHAARKWVDTRVVPFSKAKYMFKKVERAFCDTDGVVTAFRDGEVVLRSQRRMEGFTEATEFHGYHGVAVGDLVIHSMDGFAGAIGISKSSGKMSPVAHIYSPQDGIEPRFYAYLLKHLAAEGFIQSLSKGIRERSTSFDSAIFLSLDLPVVSLSEQQDIANLLDRFGSIIEKKREIIQHVVAWLSSLEHQVLFEKYAASSNLEP